MNEEQVPDVAIGTYSVATIALKPLQADVVIVHLLAVLASSYIRSWLTALW